MPLRSTTQSGQSTTKNPLHFHVPADSAPSSAAFLKWWATNVLPSGKSSDSSVSPIQGGFYRPESLQPQSFLGRLIATRRNACNTTFVLRNAFDQVGVEMTFSLYSPLLVAIQVIRRHKQKKSKWYHLREHPISESSVQEPKSIQASPPPYHYLTTTKPSSTDGAGAKKAGSK